LFVQAACALYGHTLVSTRTRLASLYFTLPVSDATVPHELGQPPFGFSHITKVLGRQIHAPMLSINDHCGHYGISRRGGLGLCLRWCACGQGSRYACRGQILSPAFLYDFLRTH
jgi:hypothetical protein